MKNFNLKHKLISLWVTWQVIGMVSLYWNAGNESGSAKCVLLKPFKIHLWLIMSPGPLGVLSLQLDISKVLSTRGRQWDVMSRGWEFIIHAKKVLVADHLVTSLHIQIHKIFPWHLTWRVILTPYHQPTPTISTMRSKRVKANLFYLQPDCYHFVSWSVLLFSLWVHHINKHIKRKTFCFSQ